MLVFRFNYKVGREASRPEVRCWKVVELHGATARSEVHWAPPGCLDWDSRAISGPVATTEEYVSSPFRSSS